jgi:hypothetical protein
VGGHAVWERSTLASGVASAALGSVGRQYAGVIPARASATRLESLIGATSQVHAVPARVSAGVGSEKMTSTKVRRFSAFDRVSRHPQRRFLMLFPNNWKHKNRQKHWIFCGVASFEQD